jgi:light-regulated signal transduction histidine kinase (bacteriophytochrome)
MTPLGVSAWIFFVVPILIAYLGLKEKYFFPLVIILGIIIIADSFLKETRIIDFNIAILNRISGILVFFFLAALFRRQKKNNRELNNLNITLENRVKERTFELEKSRNELDSLIHQLAEKVEKLNQTNAELETFAYTVSHDLRAPLRHIYGNAELLQNIAQNNLGEQGMRHLELILKSSLRVSDMVEDLLSFTSMGRIEMNIEPLDLNKIFSEVINHQQPVTIERNIKWNIKNLPPVSGDALMLKSVAECLISNAIKFTRYSENPEITIGAIDSNSKEVTVFVSDNGEGFDMQNVERLFSVFSRLHRQPEFEGTGLGLANVKRIIERHGGKVWAQGKPSAGASFFFSIPLAHS